jgi:hypothetical protein
MNQRALLHLASSWGLVVFCINIDNRIGRLRPDFRQRVGVDDRNLAIRVAVVVDLDVTWSRRTLRGRRGWRRGNA